MADMNDGTGATADALLAHAGWMRSLARSLVRDSEHADDVVQESWVSAIERPPRHAENVSGWLRRVVTNRARQQGRSEERRVRREHAGARAEALPSAEELVLEAELQREVVSAILKLAEPYRSTVLLRFYRDLTPKEIATRLGIPAATVRSRLKRALAELRGDLDRRYGGERSAWSAALLPFAGSAALVVLSVKAKLVLGAAGIAIVAALVSTLRNPPAPAPAAPDPIVAADDDEELEPLVEREETDVAEVESPTDEERVALEADATPPALVGVYHGTVSDPDGEPIPDATLRIFPKDRGNWHELEPLAVGTTGVDGRFEIPVPDGLDTGRYILIEALAERHQSLSMDPIVPKEPVAITLNWTTEVFGHVLDDETGAPIGGARVSYWTTETTSAPDGTYRLPGIPVSRNTRISVFREGYASTVEAAVADTREPFEHTIRLRRGVPLSLTAVSADTGDPIARVAVLRDRESWLGETDASGELVVRVLAGQEMNLTVAREGYAELFWVFDVKDADTLEPVRVPMRGLGWIDGTLRDGSGEPLPGCWLYARNEDAPSGWRLSDDEQREFGIHGYVKYEVPRDLNQATDESGSFSIAAIPHTGPYRLSGGSREHVSADAGPVYLTEAGQRVRVEVVQRTGATIRGRVSYNGEPWSEGSVESFLGDDRGPSSRIDTDGSYLLRAVPAGDVTLQLRSWLGRRDLSEPVELAVEAGRDYERDIAWEEELVPIRGFVFEADGAPVAGQNVSASRHGPDGYVSFRAQTADDGSFSIDVALGAPYRVGAFRRPASDAREDVSPGSEGIRLVLPEIGRVRFRLVDAETGKSVHAAESNLWGLGWRESGTEVFSTVRDPNVADGVIELELPLATAAATVDLDLYLNDDGYHPRQAFGLPVARGDETHPVVEIELERGVDCTLKLVGDEPLTLERRRGHLFFLLHDDQLASVRGPFPAQGGPSNHRINGVNMWVAEPGLLYQLCDIDDAGLAILRGLEPGRYTLRVFPDDYAFDPATFELPGDGAAVEIHWSER